MYTHTIHTHTSYTPYTNYTHHTPPTQTHTTHTPHILHTHTTDHTHIPTPETHTHNTHRHTQHIHTPSPSPLSHRFYLPASLCPHCRHSSIDSSLPGALWFHEPGEQRMRGRTSGGGSELGRAVENEGSQGDVYPSLWLYP